MRLVDGPDGVRAVLVGDRARGRGARRPPADRCPQALWEVHAVVDRRRLPRGGARAARARGRAPDARRRPRTGASPSAARAGSATCAAACRGRSCGRSGRPSARCGAASAADRNFRAIRRVELVVRRSLLLALLAGLLLAVVPAPSHAARGACVAGVPGRSCDVWTGTVRSSTTATRWTSTCAATGRRASRRIRITGIQAMEQTVYTARPAPGRLPRGRGDGAAGAARPPQQGARAAGGRGPAEHVARRFMRTVAVKVRGRWRDVGTILMREGLALWWPTVGGVGRRTRATACCAQRAIAAQRGLFDPDACGVGPERGLAAQAVGQLGRRRRRHRQPVGRVGQDPQPRPGQPGPARRLVPARLGPAPLHLPAAGRDPARRDRSPSTSAPRATTRRVFPWGLQGAGVRERGIRRGRDGRRRVPVRPARQRPRDDGLPVPDASARTRSRAPSR